MGINGLNRLNELEEKIKELQDLRDNTIDIEERKQFDDSIIKLTEEYRVLTGEAYQSPDYK